MSRRGEIAAPARDVSVANLGGAGRHGFSHRLRLQLAGLGGKLLKQIAKTLAPRHAAEAQFVIRRR